ncbi:MAG: DNA polymerase III subunit alpha [Candidatus Aminicenantes bacterium]|nr:DNA polymerase III subunit alpha [Candidatus Aminicenantes bacterium]
MYVPLRVHSVFSRGRGGATLEDLAWWFTRKKVPAGALSDVEKLYGWAKWKRASAAAGFAPLFGCEIEVGGGRFLFLVKSREGYGNLMEILNRREIREGAGWEGLAAVYIPGPKEGPPKKGDRIGIPENSDPVPRFASFRDGPSAGDIYIGADFFNMERARSLARSLALPLVWANPLKYVRSPERLVLLHAFDKKIPYPPAWEKLRRTVRLFGPDQEEAALRKFGPEVGEAFRRTFEVAEKARFEFAAVVPPLPADIFPVTLRDEVRSRLRTAKDLSWAERERAKRELAVIEKSGFAPYFLIVHDVVGFARRNGILHNLKGSGASSFLAWLLGLSHVNPVAFDLYFERFLNPGRDDPPDIDLDFDSRFRDKVLAYVLETYGRGRTGAAFVCSLKDFRARSALYETARAMGLPPEECRALSRRAPYFAEPDYLRKAEPPAGCLEVWKLAAELGGVHSEVSLHVGGVILTPSPADRCLPLEKSAKGFPMSHYDRDAVEDLKLIKLDLLSVRGLAAISAAKAGLGLAEIPPADPKAYALLKSARTIGCFQVESPAMMNLLRRMRPGDIRDLTAALALIRPGPTESGMKEKLLRSREGRGVAGDPVLAKILPETDGLLLYEEQVMQVAERVAGMTPEEGDLLRRSLRAKGESPKAVLRGRFFQEARERGYAGAEVERLWQTMEKFSSYAFNKAHSASYAAMAYQAVYLKARHPVPYLAAVLNAGGGYYMLSEYIEEAKRLGIRILGPDANRSGYGFEVEGEAVRVGFTSIKGLALRTAEKVIEERTAGGAFPTLEDFIARVHVSKAELFTLIKAGVFDSLEAQRTRQILRYFQGLPGVEVTSDLDAREKAKQIVESLGFSPDGDPLALYEGKRPDLRVRDLRRRVGERVELVLRLVDARGREANGKRTYFYLFEDETGLLEGIGDRKCLTVGEPPVCCLRGEVRADGRGGVKIFDCAFLRAF